MKLRITPDGVIHGLWDDGIDWPAVGHVHVRRASHVEFCRRRQRWGVQIGQPRSWWRRLLQWLLRRPCGETLYWAPTRSEALAWELEHFAPGGPGWPGRVTDHAQRQSN
jgi:hypothetical protein